MFKKLLALGVLVVPATLALVYLIKTLEVPPLSIEEISNTAVPTVWSEGEVVHLKNGSYKEDIKSEKGEYIGTFSIDLLTASSTYMSSDLNSDGARDILVTTVGTAGGTGYFYELLAFINEKGNPRYAGELNLGDRIQVNKISAEKGIITVDIVTRGPNEGMCCGTLRQVKRYTFDGQGFKEI